MLSTGLREGGSATAIRLVRTWDLDARTLKVRQFGPSPGAARTTSRNRRPPARRADRQELPAAVRRPCFASPRTRQMGGYGYALGSGGERPMHSSDSPTRTGGPIPPRPTSNDAYAPISRRGRTYPKAEVLHDLAPHPRRTWLPPPPGRANLLKADSRAPRHGSAPSTTVDNVWPHQSMPTTQEATGRPRPWQLLFRREA
jgi:hypothetical protein